MRRPHPALPLLAALAVALLLPGVRAGLASRAALRAPLPLPDGEVVRQTHPQGCGAALVATLAARAGRPVSADRLLRLEPPGPDGVSLRGFARLTRHVGLPGRWRRAPGRPPGGRVADLEPPFVAHLDDPTGHFVWVAGAVGPYRHVLDPAAGAALWHASALARRASGHVFHLDAPPGAGADAGSGP